MDEKRRLELALFRFSLIAPLVNGSLDTPVHEYLEAVCAKSYDAPGLGSREFSPRTLLAWRSLYGQYGLEGLKGKQRADRGHFRRLSSEARMFLAEALRRNPKATGTALYEELAQARLLGHPPCSLSTVQRFLRTVEIPHSPGPERRRFVFAHANDCWQTDVCVGPHLMNSHAGRKHGTYLLAVLDDASRLCVHAAFVPEADSAAFEHVLQTALQKRGIPQRLYLDNAKIFRSLQLQAVCARLGIVLCHSQPYQPEGRGKIERFFRTVREQCFSRLGADDLVSLDALNRRFAEYVEQVYNSRPHGSLEGKSPMERFLADQEHLRFLPEQRVGQAFLHEVERRVAKDATVSLLGAVFELPQVFVGQKVRLLFHAGGLEQAWVLRPDGSTVPVRQVRPVDNARIPRSKRSDPIDYSILSNKEES